MKLQQGVDEGAVQHDPSFSGLRSDVVAFTITQFKRDHAVGQEVNQTDQHAHQGGQNVDEEASQVASKGAT